MLIPLTSTGRATRSAIPGVLVRCYLFDVDDPFDQIHGALGLNDVANVGLIDNDTDGDDNRGRNDPAASYYIRETDENGEVRVTLTMSMQPGNNYRAAASVIGDVFGGSEPQASQADADAKQYDHDPGWLWRGCEHVGITESKGEEACRPGKIRPRCAAGPAPQRNGRSGRAII